MYYILYHVYGIAKNVVFRGRIWVNVHRQAGMMLGSSMFVVCISEGKEAQSVLFGELIQ